MIHRPKTMRRFGRRFPILAGTLLSALAFSGAALSADKIGSTEISKNVVEQVTGKAAAPISVNDAVFANEAVRTGADSSAKFVFSDSTNLAIGPTSTVKLDRFVYNTGADYKKAAIKFAAGAFRFTTGGSEKKAYELKTDTATIGVRGTILEVLVRNGETFVTLIEGECVVCPRSKYDSDPRNLTKAQIKKYHCQDMTQPNQTTRTTSSGVTPSSTPVSFAENYCGGGGGLCSTSTATAANNGPLMCYMKQD